MKIFSWYVSSLLLVCVAAMKRKSPFEDPPAQKKKPTESLTMKYNFETDVQMQDFASFACRNFFTSSTYKIILVEETVLKSKPKDFEKVDEIFSQNYGSPALLVHRGLFYDAVEEARRVVQNPADFPANISVSSWIHDQLKVQYFLRLHQVYSVVQAKNVSSRSDLLDNLLNGSLDPVVYQSTYTNFYSAYFLVNLKELITEPEKLLENMLISFSSATFIKDIKDDFKVISNFYSEIIPGSSFDLNTALSAEASGTKIKLFLKKSPQKDEYSDDSSDTCMDLSNEHNLQKCANRRNPAQHYEYTGGRGYALSDSMGPSFQSTGTDLLSHLLTPSYDSYQQQKLVFDPLSFVPGNTPSIEIVPQSNRQADPVELFSRPTAILDALNEQALQTLSFDSFSSNSENSGRLSTWSIRGEPSEYNLSNNFNGCFINTAFQIFYRIPGIFEAISDIQFDSFTPEQKNELAPNAGETFQSLVELINFYSVFEKRQLDLDVLDAATVKFHEYLRSFMGIPTGSIGDTSEVLNKLIDLTKDCFEVLGFDFDLFDVKFKDGLIKSGKEDERRLVSDTHLQLRVFSDNLEEGSLPRLVYESIQSEGHTGQVTEIINHFTYYSPERIPTLLGMFLDHFKETIPDEGVEEGTTHKFDLNSLSDIFTVNLNRSSFVNDSPVHVFLPVEIPLQLNASDFMNCDEDQLYELFAVSVFVSSAATSSGNGGHYVAYVRDLRTERQWKKYDDMGTVVETLTFDEIEEVFYTHSYSLVYLKQNLITDNRIYSQNLVTRETFFESVPDQTGITDQFSSFSSSEEESDAKVVQFHLKDETRTIDIHEIARVVTTEIRESYALNDFSLIDVNLLLEHIEVTINAVEIPLPDEEDTDSVDTYLNAASLAQALEWKIKPVGEDESNMQVFQDVMIGLLTSPSDTSNTLVKQLITILTYRSLGCAFLFDMDLSVLQEADWRQRVIEIFEGSNK